MERNSAVLSFLIMFVIWSCLGIGNAKGEHHKTMLKEKVTHLQFYMHDIIVGNNASAIQVAPETPMNFSAENVPFGPVFVIDDPLTETPDNKSKMLGRAQGLYAMSSEDELGLFMAMTFSMDSGRYKGSSLSIVGRNMVTRKQREMPIVGGSGDFRMARGYVFIETQSSEGPNFVLLYNATVFHYGSLVGEANMTDE